jgi:hypothetical protein
MCRLPNCTGGHIDASSAGHFMHLKLLKAEGKGLHLERCFLC